LGSFDQGVVPHDVRDQVVDFVRRWSEKTEIGAGRSASKRLRKALGS
jgi:hypothetical protein